MRGVRNHECGACGRLADTSLVQLNGKRDPISPAIHSGLSFCCSPFLSPLCAESVHNTHDARDARLHQERASAFGQLGRIARSPPLLALLAVALPVQDGVRASLRRSTPLRNRALQRCAPGRADESVSTSQIRAAGSRGTHVVSAMQHGARSQHDSILVEAPSNGSRLDLDARAQLAAQQSD